MSNESITLPVVLGTGVGASVNASQLGANKTIILGGLTSGAVTVEISQDDSEFAPLATFTADGKQFRLGNALFMRVRSSVVGGTPSVDVGAETGAVEGISLPVPAGDGVAASVDVTQFGSTLTFIIGGDLDGPATLIIEGSEDDSDYAPLVVSSDGGAKTLENVAVRFLRVRASGVTSTFPFAPVVGVVGVPSGGGGGIASNVLVEEGDETTTTIVVRPGGDDTTGNGTIGAPYETLRRAVLDVPAFIPRTDRYVIDITGIDEDMGPLGDTFGFIGGLMLPTWHSAGELKFDLSPPVDPSFFFSTPVSIRAALTDVLTGLVIDSVTTDPDTGLLTYNFLGAPFVPGAHVGQFLRSDATGFMNGVIASNTASSLEMTVFFGAGATDVVDIVDTGAILRNSDGATFACLQRRNGSAYLGLFGIDFQHSAGSPSARSLAIHGGPCGDVFGQSNRYEGLRVTAGGNDENSPSDNSHIKGGFQIGAKVFSRSAFWDAVTCEAQSPAFDFFPFSCIVDGGTGIRCFGGSTPEAANGINISTCLVRNADNGAVIEGGGASRNRIQFSKFNDNVGDAIIIRGSSFTNITEAYGTGNGGVGLNVESGSQVITPVAQADMTVTGAGGDFTLGGLAVDTWANFYALAPKDLTDLAAANPQLCRMF